MLNFLKSLFAPKPALVVKLETTITPDTSDSKRLSVKNIRMKNSRGNGLTIGNNTLTVGEVTIKAQGPISIEGDGDEMIIYADNPEYTAPPHVKVTVKPPQ
jgi:hypothetical protein